MPVGGGMPRLFTVEVSGCRINSRWPVRQTSNFDHYLSPMILGTALGNNRGAFVVNSLPGDAVGVVAVAGRRPDLSNKTTILSSSMSHRQLGHLTRVSSKYGLPPSRLPTLTPQLHRENVGSRWQRRCRPRRPRAAQSRATSIARESAFIICRADGITIVSTWTKELESVGFAQKQKPSRRDGEKPGASDRDDTRFTRCGASGRCVNIGASPAWLAIIHPKIPLGARKHLAGGS